MPKKITVTLSDKAAQYLAEVQYSLDKGNGVCSQSECISHSLEELAAFEKITDDQVTNWLQTNHPTQYNEFLAQSNNSNENIRP